MPLYEYQCHRCGKTFELLQKFSDDPVTVHDQCGGEVERLISPPALQFKGTGWYVTDYAGNGRAGSKAGHGNGKSEPKTEAGKAEAKTENKPATETKAASKSDTK